MMKKMLVLLLALMLLLPLLPAMADEMKIQNPVPEEIAELFDVPAWKGYRVAECTNNEGLLAWQYSESMEAGLVIMTNGQLNIVCLIEPDKNGNLRITQRNYAMVIGDEIPWIEIGWGETSHELNTNWGTSMFELYGGGGYYIAIGKFDGIWRVKTILDYEKEIVTLISSDKIGYIDAVYHEDGIDYHMDDIVYAYGVYDNRFASFNLHDFPRTLEAAREKLTNPPVTPTDFYVPMNITLRADEKYDVFAAPGRDSVRAANGKAVMSTNDWVQIFGEEDGWLLVQYDISRDQMRFGYVDASALPRNTEVPNLTWYDLPVQEIKYAVSMTDDPLVSGSILHSLWAGDEVSVLSSFGNWYYIETVDNSGRSLRGFVPKSCIEIIGWDEWNELHG